MPKTDIARRVYNHTWKLDPIVRSLLDTDFYKLLMLQMIWGLYPKVEATFSLINRKHEVHLTDEIDEGELRAQLDHARTLRFTKKEMIWLAGNSFYGSRQIFSPEFLRWLQDFQLPDYHLEKRGGQYELSFPGRWAETSMWEIHALAIINELRSRGALRDYGPFTLDVTYARAKAKMWEKVERLKQLRDLRISDFGTRRRHSFLWQRWCVEALKEGLGDNFTGTSNVLLAMDNDLEALGTNAHELPMVLAALAPNEEALKAAPYQVLQDWESYYGGNLKIVLPDAFGTDAFLRDAPDWVADWTGFRPNSAPEIEGGERIIDWWKERGRDPREKILIFSDGLDVDAIEGAYHHFSGKVRMAFGWGTNLTNDFIDCSPFPNHQLDPISLVVKVTSANGRPAVKLSDNPEKATGDPAEIARYLRIFGDKGRVAQEGGRLTKYSACIEWLFAKEAPSVPDRVRAAKAAGLDGIEFWKWSNKDLDAVKAALDATGIVIAGILCEPIAKITDPDAHAAFLDGVRASLAAALKLGARVMIAQAGDDRPGVPREVQHAALVKVLKEAADILNGSGVVLALEPLNDRVDHPGYYLTSTVEGLDIIDEVDRPEVRLLYDIYHSAMMGEHIEDVLDGRIDRVVHVHLADTQGRGEPGSGNMDWRARLDWLADHGYAGFVGLEYRPTGSTEDSLSFIR